MPFSNPNKLLKSSGVEGKFRCVQAESDLRPGGKWRMRVSGGCGTGVSSTVSGEYRAVRPPRLLISPGFVRRTRAGNTVRWDLEEKAGVTRVRVTQSGLTSESYVRITAAGRSS